MRKPNFTDKERKKIIAEYIEGTSYNQISKKYGVHASTIKRICDKDISTQAKAKAKKEQNTQDMLSFMDSRKTKAQEIVDVLMDNIIDKEKLSKASVRDISIALGVIVDKFTMNENQATKDTEKEIANAESVIIKIRKKAEETVNES